MHKSPGPDGISSQVLKNCATWLSGIFHFIVSLCLQKVPNLWKMSIVLPVPKKSRPVLTISCNILTWKNTRSCVHIYK